jgi:hypothetical protein
VLQTVANPQPDDVVRVMGGTTTFRKPLSANEILLPFHPPPNPHPLTKLKVETILACDWLVEIKVAQIERVGGYVPNSALYKAWLRLGELFATQDPSALPFIPSFPFNPPHTSDEA